MILETKYAIKILHTFTSILKCIMIIEFKISQCFFFLCFADRASQYNLGN